MNEPPSKSLPVGKRVAGLVSWLAASFSAAAMGAVSTPGAWYAALNKPAWNPPGWIFGPVWTVLYLMMAVAAWLVWSRGGWSTQRQALNWFIVQLLLNAVWTPLFFGLHWPGVAFGEMLVLWAAIATTVWTFWRVRRLATWLLVPYLAWVSFAAVLNFTLWRLNP